MIRLWLVLGCLAMLGLLLLGMRLGWRNRMRRQAGLPLLPAVPVELGVPQLPAATGVYVGTTFATSWQDRVVHAGLGLRAAATATLYAAGLLIERDGANPIFVPAAAIVGARLAPGLAGKVVGAGGLLVVAWRLGDAMLDTGFRADDKSAYPAWVLRLTPTDNSADREDAR
ncbi:MAG: integral rane protein [Pseudonocardiales bacterium]|nr:integral rane protein [Pseudonocardiales bacterium]